MPDPWPDTKSHRGDRTPAHHLHTLMSAGFVSDQTPGLTQNLIGKTAPQHTLTPTGFVSDQGPGLTQNLVGKTAPQHTLMPAGFVSDQAPGLTQNLTGKTAPQHTSCIHSYRPVLCQTRPLD